MNEEAPDLDLLHGRAQKYLFPSLSPLGLKLSPTPPSFIRQLTEPFCTLAFDKTFQTLPPFGLRWTWEGQEVRWGWRKYISQSSVWPETACKARGFLCVLEERLPLRPLADLLGQVTSLRGGCEHSWIICFGSFSPCTLRLSLNL